MPTWLSALYQPPQCRDRSARSAGSGQLRQHCAGSTRSGTVHCAPQYTTAPSQPSPVPAVLSVELVGRRPRRSSPRPIAATSPGSGGTSCTLGLAKKSSVRKTGQQPFTLHCTALRRRQPARLRASSSGGEAVQVLASCIPPRKQNSSRWLPKHGVQQHGALPHRPPQHGPAARVFSTAPALQHGTPQGPLGPAAVRRVTADGARALAASQHSAASGSRALAATPKVAARRSKCPVATRSPAAARGVAALAQQHRRHHRRTNGSTRPAAALRRHRRQLYGSTGGRTGGSR